MKIITKGAYKIVLKFQTTQKVCKTISKHGLVSLQSCVSIAVQFNCV